MKTKKMKYGPFTYKAYCKKAGNGLEVGFTCGTKTLFVGNFLKSAEANNWYTLMNKEIIKFSKKYWATDNTSKSFYQKFITHHLYTTYYKFINKLVAKHNRNSQKLFNQHNRKYNQLKKRWEPSERFTIKRAA